MRRGYVPEKGSNEKGEKEMKVVETHEEETLLEMEVAQVYMDEKGIGLEEMAEKEYADSKGYSEKKGLETKVLHRDVQEKGYVQKNGCVSEKGCDERNEQEKVLHGDLQE